MPTAIRVNTIAAGQTSDSSRPTPESLGGLAQGQPVCTPGFGAELAERDDGWA
jgi:hypothetical protein